MRLRPTCYVFLLLHLLILAGCLSETTTSPVVESDAKLSREECDNDRQLFALNIQYMTSVEPLLPLELQVRMFEVFGTTEYRIAESTALFAGTTLQVDAHDLIRVDDVRLCGRDLLVDFSANGYTELGLFGSRTRFEIVVNKIAASLELNTSCATPLMAGSREPAGDTAFFYVQDGCGCVGSALHLELPCDEGGDNDDDDDDDDRPSRRRHSSHARRK